MDTDEILPMNIGFLIGDVDGFLKMGQGSETAPPLRKTGEFGFNKRTPSYSFASN